MGRARLLERVQRPAVAVERPDQPDVVAGRGGAGRAVPRHLGDTGEAQQAATRPPERAAALGVPTRRISVARASAYAASTARQVAGVGHPGPPAVRARLGDLAAQDVVAVQHRLQLVVAPGLAQVGDVAAAAQRQPEPSATTWAGTARSAKVAMRWATASR